MLLNYTCLGLTIEEWKSIIEISAIVIGGLALMFIYVSFHPNMELNITTDWIESDERVLRVKIEIKNISKVICRKKKVLLQVLEYPASFDSSLSEWVPFTKEKIKYGENPVTWSNPEEVLRTTDCWYPGDAAIVELCYKCNENKYYKIGLSLTAKVSWLGCLSNLFRRRKWRNKERWTTTRIVFCGNRGLKNP